MQNNFEFLEDKKMTPLKQKIDDLKRLVPRMTAPIEMHLRATHLALRQP
jgi:hypothetical protein